MAIISILKCVQSCHLVVRASSIFRSCINKSLTKSKDKKERTLQKYILAHTRRYFFSFLFLFFFFTYTCGVQKFPDQGSIQATAVTYATMPDPSPTVLPQEPQKIYFEALYKKNTRVYSR